MLPRNPPTASKSPSTTTAWWPMLGLPDRRQLVLPAHCRKSNDPELQSHKVSWRIQPRNER